MLTKELAIVEYKQRQIVPDRLNRRDHGHYLGYAEQMVEVYRSGKGKTRRDLHRSIRKVFENEPDCPSKRIDAFCKLLDDTSTFHRDIKGKALLLRKKVFRKAAPFHPLVQTKDQLFEHCEQEIKKKIAKDFQRSWTEIEQDLYADIIDFHRLKHFEGFDQPQALLSRYNVAQVQVALYRAVDMTVWAESDLKTIIRYAKLARLMHTIQKEGRGGYKIHFDGPASVLRQTRRYGVNMARFLPALLACSGWRMHARIKTGRGGYVFLNLSPADRLKSVFPVLEEFDSGIEAAFAEKWGDEKREGWFLNRESEILHHGQKVFLPDFVLQHEDGRIVYLEIIGFWTPEYLQEKAKTLSVFKDVDILIAIAESTAESFPDLPANAIRFKSALRLKDVLSRLE